MKTIYMHILFTFFLLIKSSSFSQEITQEIRIKKIDSTETHFFIHAVTKNSKRKNILIISEKAEEFLFCKELKVNKKYNLVLKPFFTKEEISRIPLKPSRTILIKRFGYIVWNGEGDFPYVSPTIISKYIKPNKKHLKVSN